MALNKYDNIAVIGDFDIGVSKDEGINHDKFNISFDTFNLTNLVKSKTFYTNNHKSTTDSLLTNKPISFQVTSVFFSSH